MEQLHNIFHLYYYLRNFPCLDQIFSSSKILPTLLILCKDKTKEWSSKNTYPTPTKNMPNKIIAFSKASFLESPYPPFPCILSSHKPPQKRKPPKRLCSTLSLSLSLSNVRVDIEEQELQGKMASNYLAKKKKKFTIILSLFLIFVVRFC